MSTHLKERFAAEFGYPAQFFFEAPGRTELGGNHTDHQLGCVLAGAVDLCMHAAVGKNDHYKISVFSEGFGLCEVDLQDLTPHCKEAGTTASLIRGIAAAFSVRGYQVPGFDVYLNSDVLPGSGLSSSAAFEILMGTIINYFCSADLDSTEIAKIGQFAENKFFGKPCGLMDQIACASGNIVFVDFSNPEEPIVEPIPFDFSSCGYSLCIIDCGASHEGLTDVYSSIPAEMKQVAAFFYKDHLRQVSKEDFFANIPALRKKVGDRPVLRAMHFFNENDRVLQQKEALHSDDIEGYLRLVNQSGDSSWELLQNIHLPESTLCQEVAMALAVTKSVLNGRGACRVHGGGFAGTIQAYVPCDMLSALKSQIETIFGAGSCHCLNIRKQGAVLIEG